LESISGLLKRLKIRAVNPKLTRDGIYKSNFYESFTYSPIHSRGFLSDLRFPKTIELDWGMCTFLLTLVILKSMLFILFYAIALRNLWKVDGPAP
jgi:hypothetical protein